MATKAHLEGNKRYLAKLENLTVRVPVGDREKYKAFAESQGKSLNALVIELLETAMK